MMKQLILLLCCCQLLKAQERVLPPMPLQETRRLGFIAAPDSFPEERLNLPIAPGRFQPNWASINEQYGASPDWWNEAKFGVFIHWGPQAAGRSGDWYARNLYREETEAYKNHLKNFGHPSQFGYKEVLHQWNPVAWNADSLVNAFYDAGFRYALVVGVHHDNYDLWNSAYQPWNSVNVGPHKDFLAEWKKALVKKHMRMGVSFHHEYTWWWWQRAFGADKEGPFKGIPYDGNLRLQDGKGQWWEGLDPQRLYGIPMVYDSLSLEGKPFVLEDIAFGRKGVFGNHLDYAKWHATQWAFRIMDVIDHYDPDFIYTDGNSTQPFSGFKSGSGYKSDAAASVIAHFYNKAAAANQGKVDKLSLVKFSPPYNGVGTTFEGSFPRRIKTDQVWMADRAVGDWFYRPGFVYDSKAVIRTLLEDVSRGGNLTLCVSITPEGALDSGSTLMLREIGDWMRVNGQGIYGSRPWKVFAEGDLVADSSKPNQTPAMRRMPGGKLDKPHALYQFSSTDFRFTKGKDGALYVWCLQPPSAGQFIHVKSLGKKSGYRQKQFLEVRMLGTTQQTHWELSENSLDIQVPENKSVIGFRIELSGLNE